jgi:membrane protein involved in colicin uptake
MKIFLKLTAAAAALAGLSACDMLGLNGDGGGNTTVNTTNASGNAAAGNASDDDAAGKDPAEGGVGNTAAAFTGEVTRAFLVGRWTDNNDCTSTIAFRPDGRFITPTGEGLWLLDGDQLTMQGQSAVTARVQAPDANTITLQHPDGTLGRSTRCQD